MAVLRSPKPFMGVRIPLPLFFTLVLRILINSVFRGFFMVKIILQMNNHQDNIENEDA